MEVFEMVLGLVMFYTWIHTVILMTKYMKKMSGYEQAVTIAGVSLAFLYVVGTLMA